MTKKEKQTTYVERDVSWMYFNHRILQEAEKPTVPLLERLSFLGIYSNNLDEFFRVRVASLNRLVDNESLPERTGGTPRAPSERITTERRTETIPEELLLRPSQRIDQSYMALGYRRPQYA